MLANELEITSIDSFNSRSDILYRELVAGDLRELIASLVKTSGALNRCSADGASTVRDMMVLNAAVWKTLTMLLTDEIKTS